MRSGFITQSVRNYSERYKYEISANIPQGLNCYLESNRQPSPACAFVKLCVRREATDPTDDISVEGDLPFHPDTTQVGELELLVSNTVGAAARLQRRLMPDEAGD